MIIDKETNPKRNLYYLGGILIGVILKSDNNLDLVEAYQRIKEKEEISINLFTLTLDWLFMLGAVEIQKGHIKKCF